MDVVVCAPIEDVPRPYVDEVEHLLGIVCELFGPRRQPMRMPLVCGAQQTRGDFKRTCVLVEAELDTGQDAERGYNAGEEESDGASERCGTHGLEQAVIGAGAHLFQRLVRERESGDDDEDGDHWRTGIEETEDRQAKELPVLVQIASTICVRDIEYGVGQVAEEDCKGCQATEAVEVGRRVESVRLQSVDAMEEARTEDEDRTPTALMKQSGELTGSFGPRGLVQISRRA